MKYADFIIFTMGFVNTLLMLFIYIMIKIEGKIKLTTIFEKYIWIINLEIIMSIICVIAFIIKFKEVGDE